MRALESQTGERLDMARARQFGIDQIVLQRLVALAALEDEASEVGLSVGDTEVASTIREMQAFQGVNGQFDREAYAFALDRAGLSMAEFEDQLRGETARSILQGAVVAGIQPPDAYVEALFEYAREARDLTLIRFGPDDLEGAIGDPTQEDLQAQYESDPEAYTLPRRKELTYAWLSPDMLVETVPVEDEAIEELYNQRSDEYDRPETRLVERLVFDSEESAQSAADAIAAGETDFETLVADRGLDLADTDLGTVAATDLGEASDAVFGPDEPGVVGPAPSSLGPALYRVNAILEPQQIPLEDVRDELRGELAADAARRAAERQREPVSDMLAGGATLEEIAQETEFELGKIVWSGAEGGEDGAEIDAYEEFRAVAEAAEDGDFPEVMQLSDNGLFALRVDGVLEPELQPLDAVEDRVATDWEAAQRRARLTEMAEQALSEIEDGASPGQVGGTVSRETGILRDGFLEGLPQQTIPAAFALDDGAAEVLPTGDGALIVRVDGITVPGGGTEEAQAVKEGVRTAAGQGIAEDITSAFTSALEAQKGIEINSQAVSAVLSQFN